MVNVWKPTPQFKVTVGSTTYTNEQAMNIEVTRPENNISSCVLSINDYQSSKYEGVFNLYTNFSVALRYGSDSWETIFDGHVAALNPSYSSLGELLTISAWGQEYALVKTHANTSYGVESTREDSAFKHNVLNTPQEIIQNIIGYYVVRTYGTLPLSNYSTDSTGCDDVHNDLSVTYINLQYLDCFSAINRVCDLVNAHAQNEAEVGIHWYVEPDEHFMCKKIDADHTSGRWDHYWGGMIGTDPGTQASSTITVKQDMILYDFRKNMDEYANDIIVSSAFRLPGEDRWTEYDGVGAGGSALWSDVTGNVTFHDSKVDTPDAGDPSPVVGFYDLKIHPDDGNVWEFRYPSADASWDLTKITSPKTPAFLSFYTRFNETMGANSCIRLHTDATNYFEAVVFQTLYGTTYNKWVLFQLPIGPYHELWIDTYKLRWVKGGVGANPSWSNINYIKFSMDGNADGYMYLDDLHLSGLVTRRAYDSGAFATYECHQKVLRNDTALTDCLIANTATPGMDAAGTIAQLAYSELKRRMTPPTVGIIQIPMAPSLLPGQTVHIHACQQNNSGACAVCGATGTWRIAQDMRVKELKHQINMVGYRTLLNLTSDVTNSNAFSAPTMASLLQEYAGALMHMEAQDLKGSGLDNLIPMLEKDY